jgi:acetate kinase
MHFVDGHRLLLGEAPFRAIPRPSLARYLLVLNAGSSSVKFSVFEAGDGLHARWSGQIEGFGASPHFEVREGGQTILSRAFDIRRGDTPHKAAFAALFDWLLGVMDRSDLIAAGHRVVHGGGLFLEPALIDAATLEGIEAIAPLAPLHQPHNAAGIRAVAELAPDLPQVACFDTAFHRTIPEHAYTLALPKPIREAGVRRYGFHGLNYENVAHVLPSLLAPDKRRVVAAHLGNGASLCAMLDGASRDTTMSFTALDGLIMGTRPGGVDPGVLLHMLRAGVEPDALEDLLYKHSGLLGLSGVSSDMRTLLESPAPDAALAIDCFVHRIVQQTAAMAASLGGLDALVFTAGIGERSAMIRERICIGLGWLGLRLDAEANARHAAIISAPDSAISALIVPADEEGVIARYTQDIAGKARP